ncbi:hypothetical protein CKA32_004221 [Geitlerinema sp. FC II]|nr:hypothetical protein CKA32_004221 [Geitlerinema sp. FC II]
MIKLVKASEVCKKFSLNQLLMIYTISRAERSRPRPEKPYFRDRKGTMHRDLRNS